MAKIIPIAEFAARRVPETRTRSPGKPCQIIIFDGVRYEPMPKQKRSGQGATRRKARQA